MNPGNAPGNIFSEDGGTDLMDRRYEICEDEIPTNLAFLKHKVRFSDYMVALEKEFRYFCEKEKKES
jgi:hypothetical protein